MNKNKSRRRLGRVWTLRFSAAGNGGRRPARRDPAIQVVGYGQHMATVACDPISDDRRMTKLPENCRVPPRTKKRAANCGGSGDGQTQSRSLRLVFCSFPFYIRATSRGDRNQKTNKEEENDEEEEEEEEEEEAGKEEKN